MVYTAVFRQHTLLMPTQLASQPAQMARHHYGSKTRMRREFLKLMNTIPTFSLSSSKLWTLLASTTCSCKLSKFKIYTRFTRCADVFKCVLLCMLKVKKLSFIINCETEIYIYIHTDRNLLGFFIILSKLCL